MNPSAAFAPVRSLRKISASAGLAAGIFLSGALPAAASAPVDQDVARLSVLTQEVDVRRADSGDTFAAALNTPLSIGDELSTADSSFAEVEFDYGAAMRLAPDTQLRFTRLEPNDHIAQLAGGTIEVRVFRGLASHPEIDTPGAAIRPDDRGKVRVTVGSDGNTQVTVRAGQADIEAGNASQTIASGASIFISGTGDRARIESVAVPPLDGFDRFNDDRDAYLGHTAASTQADTYADEGLVGADELGQYGQWVGTSYGLAWEPTDQAGGWAPYHAGRFIWEPYYGWTWVADEPWGWAPYHYGNWFYNVDNRWAWFPGAYSPAQRFAYAPALVAFFGYGGGDAESAFENVGWVPIAPGEPFSPWWGYGGNGWGYGNTTIVNNYINTTTVVNNVVTVYKNVNAPGGAVSVNNGAFSGGSFGHITPIRPIELGGAHLFRGGIVPIVPTPKNLAYGGAQTSPVATQKSSSPLGFRNFKALAIAPRSFALQRAAVATVATKFYPEHATVFATQVRAFQPATPAIEALPVSKRQTQLHPLATATPSPTSPRKTDPFARFTPKPSSLNGVHVAPTDSPVPLGASHTPAPFKFARPTPAAAGTPEPVAFPTTSPEPERPILRKKRLKPAPAPSSTASGS